MSIVVFSHDDCLKHIPNEQHPECPARIEAINDQLIRSGLDFVLIRKEATEAPWEAIQAAHSQAHIDFIRAEIPEYDHEWVDPDTLVTPGSLTAALKAAGAAVNAVDDVMTTLNKQAFCAVRPPGHHATRSKAMGFCLFNNVAVAAYHAIEKHGLERVAIVDFDVHHGNGTEDIVQGDDRILFCSSFQQAFYPFTGEDTSAGNVHNVPLPAGCKGEQWQQAVSEKWFHTLNHFQPQLVLISAGFDGHAEDDMSQFLLKEEDYHWISVKLKEIADKHCDGRIVSTLEGGYNLSALGRSVVAHLKGLL
jgi:acetoin utilization deacetylase AcuC-like enzyme